MKETKEGFRVGVGGEKWEFPAISMNKDITFIMDPSPPGQPGRRTKPLMGSHQAAATPYGEH